ncbi:hypothetical protein ACWC4A_52930 [Streptomyces mirabilis]
MPLLEVATESASKWAWGWEALVAIGTGILAVATGGLALFTATLASRTSRLADEGAADQRAQWRPVVLPVYDEIKNGDIALGRDSKRMILVVGLHNAGRGPALHVRIELEVAGNPQRLTPRESRGPLGALAPDEQVQLEFKVADFTSDLQLLCDYRDVADRPYASSVTITFSGDPVFPNFYDVRCWEEHTVTSVSDSGYPKPGLTDLSPRQKPKPDWLDPNWPDG